MSPKFGNVSCSQCGESFGPGDSGFSHCNQHDFILRDGRNIEAFRISFQGSNQATIGLPLRMLTVDLADLAGLRNWLERKLGCLYDQAPEQEPPMADGERG